jgi:hypothetical protein
MPDSRDGSPQPNDHEAERVWRARRFPKGEFQYAFLPYVNLHISSKAKLTSSQPEPTSFALGGFSIWRDDDHNWQRFLGRPRPVNHLGMYLDRDARPVQTGWVVIPAGGSPPSNQKWEQLIACLFYLGFARSTPFRFDLPKADDFYSERFTVSGQTFSDTAEHVRFSKYEVSWVWDLKIYQPPDVHLNGTRIVLPDEHPLGANDNECADLFRALSLELTKNESRLLTALVFFFHANFRAASRSSREEDIQNVCSAFEALLEVEERGDTATRVSRQLQVLFREKLDVINEKTESESEDVLKQLDLWVEALYRIRNAYTHGKPTPSGVLAGGSLWHEMFELFALAANRKILGRPESLTWFDSPLSKLLMPCARLDAFIRMFRSGRHLYQETMSDPAKRTAVAKVLLDLRDVETDRIASIPSVEHFERALFSLSCFTYRVLRTLADKSTELAALLKARIQGLEDGFSRTQTEAQATQTEFSDYLYLLRAKQHMRNNGELIPILGGQMRLSDLMAPFEPLFSLYVDFRRTLGLPIKA